MKQIAVKVGAQMVHLRVIGKGRPVALFHESPRSSHVLLDLANRIADQFTVLAFDNPGYGLSDPMPLDRPSIDDFADVFAGALRALGLGPIPVYGIHTGATIAARLAVRHPQQVAGLVFDGYPLFSDIERATHEAFYLPEFAPRWDGGHILALWSRVRDQHSHFPWYLRSHGARLNYDWPLERMRGVFHDFLRAGPHYLTAYSSSFRFDGGRTLDEMNAIGTSYHLLARAQDVLSPHLSRFQNLPANCSLRDTPPDPEGWSALIAELLNAIPGEADLPKAPTAIEPDARGVLAIGADSLACRVYGNGQASTARIFLHDQGESGRLLADATKRLMGDGLIIVPEMLAGLSDQQIIDGLTDILARLGQGAATISGAGANADMAQRLARLSPLLTAMDAPLPAAPQGPSLDPALPARMDGADLIAHWFALRDAELAHQATREGDELLAGADIHRLHARFVARLLSTASGF